MTAGAPVLSLRNVWWLLAALAMVGAPHAGRVPWWITALAVTLMAWRGYLARFNLGLPSRWLLLLVIAGGTAGVFVSYGTIFGRDAGVALLIIMLSLKLLELATLRDAMLLVFLGYFLVITNFLYSQTIPTALYMLGSVWFITATMIGLHFAVRYPGPAAPLRTAGVLLAQSVPLMLVFFVLFPRVQGPLWGLPRDAYAGITGLSDTMTPGSIANLSLSDAVAFRATFNGPIPNPTRLYWRGPVLWDFDGRTWSAGRPYFGKMRYETNSAPVEYTITLEPHSKRWMFALDLPARMPPATIVTWDFQILSTIPIHNRVRYEMSSYTSYRYGEEEREPVLARARRLPEGYNPRTRELARRMRGDAPDDRDLIRNVLAKFRNENFFYTLSPPPLGEHSVDEFLFATKSGFCEHYAAAFTVLMRAAGIPARIVTGYQGGEVNPITDYLIVRQADAHAWVEVWLEGQGWVRIDPTAAVSPQRVERGIAAAIPVSDPLPLLVRTDYEWLRRIRFTWDSIANNWNQWVLGYTQERQRQFLRSFGIADPAWRNLAAMLLVATGIAVLILAALVLRKLKTTVTDPVLRAYRRFCGKLARKGLPRHPAEGPADYAARLARERPELAKAVSLVSALYISLRYGTDCDPADVREFTRLVREFKA
ncbi:MAG: DUF3488 domain-containing transglutaminase family protein [Betaproteobacteria bacterium]|nr:DUF3488 domain-containing transglutaminase family protein [Betaproteobacteria bacterium]